MERYYLYYCSPGNKHGEGVATSKSPNGPFVNGTDIEGAYQIDPMNFRLDVWRRRQ